MSEIRVSDAAPSTIPVLQFAQARIAEIAELQRVVNSNTGLRRAFQTLPKHLRRRAMSHNIHRIPARLRAQALREVLKSTKKALDEQPQVRRGRRMSRNLLAEWALRATLKGWLETHLWHAKRFHMIELWGKRIGLAPTDKGQRAALRQAMHVTAIHDASYIRPLIVRGTTAELLDSIRHICDAESATRVAQAMDGSREVEVMLYRSDRCPFDPLAPGRVIWLPHVTDANAALCIWVHIAAISDITHELNSLTGFNIQAKQLALNRFQITGPRSHDLLYRVLDVESGAGKQTWAKLDALTTTASLRPGVAIALVAKLRKPAPLANTLINRELDETAHATVIDVAVSWPTDIAESDVWLVETARQMESVPLLLVARGPDLVRGFGSGWDVVVPPGAGMRVWTTLAHAGGRAVGMYYLAMVVR